MTKEPRPAIGLCMIVRDEAEVIERCLSSVLPLIDTWTICDTGSIDGTPDLIEKALAGVPGTVHHRQWVDFGVNRTELMELGAGTADYLLLIDADMTVQRRGAIPVLEADAYLLRHLGPLHYAVPRLVCGDRRWWFEGSTHEYLATEGEYSQELLAELVIDHHGDGGSRADKFERDARLLEAELARCPDDPRATFYLAQTRRDQGEVEQAIALYQRRVELGGWGEEVFYAAYQEGVLTARTDPAAGVRLLIDAHRRRPSRAEPLHELSRACRLLGRHRAAYAFAQRGAALPAPDDLLFVHRDVYEWGLLFEMSVSAYFVGRHREALRLSDRLLAEGRVPAAYLQAARVNRRYCIDALPASEAIEVSGGPPSDTLDRLAASLRMGQVQLDVEPVWTAYNPSIAAAGAGFRMIVRTANYELMAGRYEFVEEGPFIRTINYLAELDSELQMTGVAPLDDRSAGPPAFATAISGYEDCRLVSVAGIWFGVATVCDRNPEGICEVALLRLNGETIEHVQILPGPEPGRTEKNWMPFEHEGRLRLVYSSGPTVIYEWDSQSGVLELISERSAPEWTRGFRGGSQGVAVDGGHLFVIHEVGTGGENGRIYTHRFVLIDGDLSLAAASRRFSFTGQEIEYCAGMARCGDELVVSFGVGDRAAVLGRVNEAEVLALLQPVS